MVWTLVATIVPILLFYLWKKVTYYRTKQYAGFPQLPPSLLWGHLSTLGKLVKTICDHDIAEQISKSSKLFQYSAPKSHISRSYSDMMGPLSIVLTEVG